MAELLSQLGARGNEQIARPAWHYTEASPAEASTSGSMELRDALARCYDLRCPRERQLLQLLWSHMPEDARAAALAAMGQQQQDQADGCEGDGAVLIQAQSGSTGSTGQGDHMAPSDSASSLSAATARSKGSKGAGLAESQALRLQQLMSADADQLEAYLAERHVIDVLRDFSEAQVASAQVGLSADCLMSLGQAAACSPNVHCCLLHGTNCSC